MGLAILQHFALVGLARIIVLTKAYPRSAHPDGLKTYHSRSESPLEAFHGNILCQLATSSRLGLARQPSRLARGCQQNTKPLRHMTATVPAALAAFITLSECVVTSASCIYEVLFSLF